MILPFFDNRFIFYCCAKYIIGEMQLNLFTNKRAHFYQKKITKYTKNNSRLCMIELLSTSALTANEIKVELF